MSGHVGLMSGHKCFVCSKLIACLDCSDKEVSCSKCKTLRIEVCEKEGDPPTEVKYICCDEHMYDCMLEARHITDRRCDPWTVLTAFDSIPIGFCGIVSLEVCVHGGRETE